MGQRIMKKTARSIVIALGLSLFASSAMAACKTFKEYLPVEVGGGCVIFTICCYGNHCEVYDVVDQPGLC